MSVSINKEQGWTEVILDNNCDYNKLYRSADILESDFQIAFTSKINDLETYYWDFNYKGSELTLHYNIYLGLTVFPKALNQASFVDNGNVVEIGGMLFEKLKGK